MANVRFVRGSTRGGTVIGWAIELPSGEIVVKEYDRASKKRPKRRSGSTRRRSAAQRRADRKRSTAMKRHWRGARR